MRLSWLAAAATLIVAVGLGGTLAVENARLATIVADDGVALATVATSHFIHASFIGQAWGAPPAKVLYGRDGTWLYVVVDAARETGTSRAIQAQHLLTSGCCEHVDQRPYSSRGPLIVSTLCG